MLVAQDIRNKPLAEDYLEPTAYSWELNTTNIYKMRNKAEYDIECKFKYWALCL